MEHRPRGPLRVAWPLVAITPSLVASCGPPSPPALAYAVPTTPEVRYEIADTSVVHVSIMGQNLELRQAGVGSYAVVFGPSDAGVSVSLTVEDLAATIRPPMGDPLVIDEGDVRGDLVYTLDRRGGATVSSTPRVEDNAIGMVSGLSLAHTFFPRLPGRPIAAGESWIDTVSFEGREGSGGRSETWALRHTIVGDTVVAGRPLLAISVTGTGDSTNDVVVSGMSVSQVSTLDLVGHVLWDYQRGLMVESVRTVSGTGTASVSIAPAPLPIRMEATQRARLQER